MEDKELEKTIKEIQIILNQIGDINMNCDSRSRTLYQKKLNNSFSRLYELKKHLEFVRKMRNRNMRFDLDDEELRKTRERNGLEAEI